MTCLLLYEIRILCVYINIVVNTVVQETKRQLNMYIYNVDSIFF